MPDKLTSPAGEEFVLADASVNRVLVKGVVAVMHARTERLWSTKEGDMFLCADAEGNLDAEQATGAGFYWRDTRYLSDFRLEVDGPSRARSTSAAPGSSTAACTSASGSRTTTPPPSPSPSA